MDFHSTWITRFYFNLCFCKHSAALNVIIPGRNPDSLTSGTDGHADPLQIHKLPPKKTKQKKKPRKKTLPFSHHHLSPARFLPFSLQQRHLAGCDCHIPFTIILISLFHVHTIAGADKSGYTDLLTMLARVRYR